MNVHPIEEDVVNEKILSHLHLGVLWWTYISPKLDGLYYWLLDADNAGLLLMWKLY